MRAPCRRPHPLALRAFDRYVRSQLARHFATTRLAGPGTADPWDPSVPTLVIANHTNWWDGFLAFTVGRALGLESHVYMDAVQLSRYPLFRMLGAVPLRREHPREAYEDLLDGAACLRPGAALWIFPQGGRRPPGERPRCLERGAALIALGRERPLRICAAAFRYVYLGEQLPEAFVQLGRPWLLEPGRRDGRRSLMSTLERDLLAAVDALDAALATEALGAFRVVVQGRLSVNKRLDRARHAMGLLPGPFEARNG